MGKSKKIEVKNVNVTENEDKDFIIEGFEGEEVPFENLSDEIREMMKLGQLNIKITKFRKGKAPIRKKEYKYKCPKCERQIKSTEENLEAECLDCNIQYKKVKE